MTDSISPFDGGLTREGRPLVAWHRWLWTAVFFFVPLMIVSIAFIPTRSEPDPLGVTLEAYKSLSKGMTYDQCAKALGGPGVEAPDPSAESYTWANEDMSHVILTFRDGRLVEKRQFGL